MTKVRVAGFSISLTDLDLQLKKHGIHQLIVMGLIAHTCVEATVRFAAELGYRVGGALFDLGFPAHVHLGLRSGLRFRGDAIGWREEG